MKTLAKARILVTRFPYESQLGGEEMHTIALMKELDKKNHEAFFLGSDPVLKDLFEKAGFEVKKAWLGKPPVTKSWLILFTLLSPILFFLAGLQLKQAKKKWGVNVVYMHSFGEKLMMTPWAHLFGMKVLWLEHARIGKWLTKNPWRLVYKWFSKWSTVIVTSNAMLIYLDGLAKNIKAISCGVIVEKSAPLNEKISKFLRSGFSLGTVARLTIDKGIDIIVRLVHSKPDMRLIIVGEGPLLEQVQKLGNSEQVLVLPNMPRPQLMALYKELDLFILASREMDPFGMVAAEAMWQGTPVLMTDKCGISKDLHDGYEAIIVPAKKSNLDRAVKKLMKHEANRDKIGRAGQKFVKEHYLLAKMVQSFEELLLTE